MMDQPVQLTYASLWKLEMACFIAGLLIGVWIC